MSAQDESTSNEKCTPVCAPDDVLGFHWNSSLLAISPGGVKLASPLHGLPSRICNKSFVVFTACFVFVCRILVFRCILEFTSSLCLCLRHFWPPVCLDFLLFRICFPLFAALHASPRLVSQIDHFHEFHHSSIDGDEDENDEDDFLLRECSLGVVVARW